MKVNVQELDKVILQSGIKKSKIAEILGINKSTLSCKLSGKRAFKIAEIYVLCDILHIEGYKKHEIFLM